MFKKWIDSATFPYILLMLIAAAVSCWVMFSPPFLTLLFISTEVSHYFFHAVNKMFSIFMLKPKVRGVQEEPRACSLSKQRRKSILENRNIFTCLIIITKKEIKIYRCENEKVISSKRLSYLGKNIKGIEE